jgi:transcriptional regulator with PAS, ATPase and Fis domain
LGELVRAGKFREDLFYRVNVMNIYLPPLRERPQDVFPLARHFLEKYRDQAIHAVEGISDEAMRVLSSYSWPGNVRELENVIQRAVVLCRNPYVSPDDLAVSAPQRQEPLLPDRELLPLKDAMRKVERHLIMEGLKAAEGNRKEAARLLGINRTTLYNKMHEHGIMES